MEPIKAELVIIGGGPGGYAAAFYAADRGQKVTLIEQEKRLGGVCLNRGCIPSKALLHTTAILNEAKESAHRGITFESPKVDLKQMKAWKDSVLEKLGQGLNALAKKRGIEVLNGRARFENSRRLRIESQDGQKFLEFKTAIIAVGSNPAIPKAFDLGNPRVMTSTEALELPEVPQDLLIVGGGYIGMELGTVYAALGSKVVVAEAASTLLMGADPDLVRPVARYAQKHFREVRLNTKVVKMVTQGKQIKVVQQIEGQQKEELYDRVLVAVGRVPNCKEFGLEDTQIARDENGYIQVNEKQQTSDPAIYAIGDVTGGVLLAHRASKQAKVAVDAILGESSVFKNIIIPAVVFTNPEIAWCGITEAEAAQKNIEVKIAKFPWGASGRALTLDRVDGLTKLIIDPDTERILGVGIVGPGAGELIGEGVLAIEMGATARDLAECVHPHPTLSETLMESAEVFYGHATHFSR
jgi:dihydrolipoamide dehydrogenase